MTPQEIDRIENAIRHIESSLDVDPWAAEIAVEAMRKQIDHIADSGKKVERTAEAIKALEATSPCDLCVNNPPSSMDGKPCSCCPAESYQEE